MDRRLHQLGFAMCQMAFEPEKISFEEVFESNHVILGSWKLQTNGKGLKTGGSGLLPQRRGSGGCCPGRRRRVQAAGMRTIVRTGSKSGRKEGCRIMGRRMSQPSKGSAERDRGGAAPRPDPAFARRRLTATGPGTDGADRADPQISTTKRKNIFVCGE